VTESSHASSAWPFRPFRGTRTASASPSSAPRSDGRRCLRKIGLDVVLLADGGRGGARGRRRRSSTMPQKRNPVLATLARARARGSPSRTRPCCRASFRSTSGAAGACTPSGRRSVEPCRSPAGRCRHRRVARRSRGGHGAHAREPRCRRRTRPLERIAATLAEQLGRLGGTRARGRGGRRPGVPRRAPGRRAQPAERRAARRAPRPDDVSWLDEHVRRPRAGALRHRDGTARGGS
jgi:hypothetical protein